MAVVDAHVRVRHPCPYCDISVAFPRTLLLLWCDNGRDVFLVSSPDEPELRRVLATLRRRLHARSLLVDGWDAVVMVRDFRWNSPPSVTGLARKTAVWVLPPVLYFDGRETYRFVAPSKRELYRLVTRLRLLGEVELLSVSGRMTFGEVRDLPVASVHFFEGLTDRQARALVAAYEGGLLDVPARGRWSEVARREGLSRSTFGEHLRKGQRRLLLNSYAALRARLGPAEPPVVLPALGARRRSRRSADIRRRPGEFPPFPVSR